MHHGGLARNLLYAGAHSLKIYGATPTMAPTPVVIAKPDAGLARKIHENILLIFVAWKGVD
jgi:hypothetical protein